MSCLTVTCVLLHCVVCSGGKFEGVTTSRVSYRKGGHGERASAVRHKDEWDGVRHKGMVEETVVTTARSDYAGGAGGRASLAKPKDSLHTYVCDGE